MSRADPDPECPPDGTSTAAWVPAVLVGGGFGGVYVATYGVDRFFEYAAMLGDHGALLQFALTAVLLAAHEAVHAVAYVLGGRSWDEVDVAFELFPSGTYDPVRVSVQPAVPMNRWAYRFGVALPGLLLGVLPSALAVATGNPLAMFVGLFGTVLLPPDVETLLDTWRAPGTLAAVEVPA